MTRIGIALALVAGSIFGIDQAEAARPWARRRGVRQQKRIGTGIRGGKLTVKEVVKLERQQVRLYKHGRKARSDGTITAGEKRHMFRAQNRASRNIFRAKHNRRRR